MHQQDPVGLITFDEKIRASLPAKSKRTQLANILALLAKQKPTGPTDVAKNLRQTASMLKHKSLVMLFSDLLVDPEPVLKAISQLRFRGHDVIIFHILDESEVHFPYDGMVDLLEPESGQNLIVDAQAVKRDYLQAIEELRQTYRTECQAVGADYVELDTSMRFRPRTGEVPFRPQGSVLAKLRPRENCWISRNALASGSQEPGLAPCG